jgi:hypothetical protein
VTTKVGREEKRGENLLNCVWCVEIILVMLKPTKWVLISIKNYISFIFYIITLVYVA